MNLLQSTARARIAAGMRARVINDNPSLSSSKPRIASLAELNREKNRRARECWEPGSAASDGDDDATGMKSAKYAAGQQPSRPSDGRSEVRVHIQSTPSDGRFQKWKLNNFTCFDFPSSGGAGGRHTDGAEAKT